MKTEYTANELKWFAAISRFYKLERLINLHRREFTGDPQEVHLRVHPKDLDALRRAARKVALAELRAPRFANDDRNALLASARGELLPQAA